jgi:hypothetical protein
VLTAWAAACNLDTGHYQRLAELARAADGPVPAWFEDYLEAERAAQSLLIWSPIVIPGLLQTGEYARVLLLAREASALLAIL